jgi:hypothetical protein
LWKVRTRTYCTSEVSLPVHDGVNRAKENEERQVAERTGEVFLPVHDGVDRAEEDEECLVVEGEDDRELVKFTYLFMME